MIFDYFPLDYYKQLEEITKYVNKEDLIVRPFEQGQFEGRITPSSRTSSGT